ncbi:hypothetical protein ACP4OV_002074 [Aristida adscensionis]
METAVVSSVLKMLAPKIFSFLQENHELRQGLELDIEYIRKELGMIAATIEDHDQRSWSEDTSEVQKAWIQYVRDVAYSIEDCMDRFLHRVNGPRLMTTRIRTKFADKIRKLRKKSEELSRLREQYTRSGGGCGSSGQSSSSGQSASRFIVSESDTHTPAAELVGMDVPRDELLELMREDEGKPKQLKVISIVGFGGLGKTDLAWQVYSSDTVAKEYEPRIWVRASEKGAGDVLGEILRQAQVGIQVHDGNSNSLSECLASRRFLIVIDDIRTEYWNTIKNAFPKSMAISSRVIVTTSIQSIANACSIDNGHVYIMKTLDAEHSKRLFLKEVSMDDYAPAEQVLKKCDGLPLALVTTAQLLQSKCQLTPDGCADLCRYMGEQVEREATFARMKHVLLQNYFSLPGHVLKACLLYLGIFPSGHPVRRKRLIRRWLAEGLVVADRRRSAAVVAIDNFKELMDRSIIKHVGMSNNSEAKTCKTHGMMLEFILQKSMCENFITLLYDQAHLPDKIRRLSLHDSGAEGRPRTTIDLSLVRSLTIFGKPDEHDLGFSKCELLRVLDLEECETLKDQHVKKICNLLLLRYLSLGGDITTLPKEISKLKYLETLAVTSVRAKILPIPIEVIKLPCLVHLIGMFKIPDVGKELRKLQSFLSEKSNLETLAGFVADQSSAFPPLISHMKKLKKVKVLCEPTADDNLTEPLQKFIQSGTKANNGRSLSLSFDRCSQDILDFHLENNSFYLSSLKLHGKLQSLPLFVTELGSVTELCLSSPGLISTDVLAALSDVRALHYLKLITKDLGRFVIAQGALKNLRRLCIVAQSITSLENEQGALPQLESLWLVCKTLNGLCSTRIEFLKRLKEVAIDEGVSEETAKEWKDAAKKHLKQPRLLLLKKKDLEQNQMQMGVRVENTEVQTQVQKGPEKHAVNKKSAGMFGGLLRSMEAYGRTSTMVSCDGNEHDSVST